MRLASLVLCALFATAPTYAGPSAAGMQRGRASGSTDPSSSSTDAGRTPSLPEGSAWLGSVRLPVRVLAGGQPLPAGTYRVRLTGEHASTEGATGSSPQLERWVEFVQANQVKGRALAPVVPAATTGEVAKAAPPARGAVRVERLAADEYYRVWFNVGGDQVLIYLPIA